MNCCAETRAGISQPKLDSGQAHKQVNRSSIPDNPGGTNGDSDARADRCRAEGARNALIEQHRCHSSDRSAV